MGWIPKCLQCCTILLHMTELCIPKVCLESFYCFLEKVVLQARKPDSHPYKGHRMKVFTQDLLFYFLTGCHALKCLLYVQILQQEAHQALMEFISTMFHRNLSRFASILQLIASLQDIDADAIEELFFRPILGEATLNALLLETLYIKPDWL